MRTNSGVVQQTGGIRSIQITMNARVFVPVTLISVASACATMQAERINISSSAPEQGAGIADALRSLEGTRAEDPARGETPKMVPTLDAIKGPFSPDRNKCALPDKIIKKVKKDPSWVPQGLSQLAGRINVKKLLHVEQADVSAILHTVHYQPSTNGTETDLVVTGTSTYLNLNPMPFIDTNKPQFVYTLDCAGYLNAAVSVSAGVSKAQIKSGAKTSLSSKNSALVARASIFPPIAVAMDPKNTPTKIEEGVSRRQQFELLYALHAALPRDADATGKITAPFQVDVLWASNSGSQTFQGEANLDASGGAALGVASVEGGTSASLSLARKSEFRDYDTYLIDASKLTARVLLVSELRKQIQDDFQAVLPSGPVDVVNGKYVFRLDLPRVLCERTKWSVAPFSTGKPPAGGSLSATYDAETGCSLMLEGAVEQQVETDGGIGITGLDGSLSFTRQLRL